MSSRVHIWSHKIKKKKKRDENGGEEQIIRRRFRRCDEVADSGDSSMVYKMEDRTDSLLPTGIFQSTFKVAYRIQKLVCSHFQASSWTEKCNRYVEDEMTVNYTCYIRSVIG